MILINSCVQIHEFLQIALIDAEYKKPICLVIKLYNVFYVNFIML